MSRRIVIEGSVTVEVSELAEEVVAEMRREGARESPSATTELPGFSIFAFWRAVFHLLCPRHHSSIPTSGKE